MKKITTALLLLYCQFAKAQDSTGRLTVSGYAEIFYSYDFNKPANNNRPAFMYSHNRHNEFNLNLGFIRAGYSTENVRANITLAAGTYMNANYAAEPGTFKNIYEACAGIRISKKNNLWLDAGIMPSHIGFESAISKDCQTLTRSIMADNTPYYETGARLSYASRNDKWLLAVMALNGWQRIKRVDGNSLMSWGTQIQYKPSGNVLLNYSNFIGTDTPDSSRLHRFFQNCYGIFTLTKKISLTAGFDIGTEQKTPGSKAKNTWYAAVIIIKHSFSKSWALAARGEYYHDKNGVIIPIGTANGFQTSGVSVGISHSPFKNVLLRAEARALNSRDKIFIKSPVLLNNNSCITTSLAIWF